MQQLDSAIEIDEEADAAYVRVSPDRVATTREVAMNIIVDFDDSEHIVGVEVQPESTGRRWRSNFLSSRIGRRS